MASSGRSVLPLVLATMTSQALLVVLAPTVVAVAAELGTPSGPPARPAPSPPRSPSRSRCSSARGRTCSRCVGWSSPGPCSPSWPAAWSPRPRPPRCSSPRTSSSASPSPSSCPAASRASRPSGPTGARGRPATSPARTRWRGSLSRPAAGVLTAAWSWRAAEALPAALAVAALVAAPARPAGPVGARGGGPGPAARTGGAPLDRRRDRRVRRLDLAAHLRRRVLHPAPGGARVRGRLAARRCRRRLPPGVGPVRAPVPPLAAAPAGRHGRADHGGPPAGDARRARSAPVAVALFCLLGLAAGTRTPVSASLGLDQLPGQPAAMMAARTGATQLGYLVGAVVGGAVISGAGYPALGLVLAVVMATSAALVLRVDDPRGPAPRDTRRHPGVNSNPCV